MTRLNNFTTDSLTDIGADNKYFTDARARSAISLVNNGSKVLEYDSSNGKLTYTPLTDGDITKKIVLAESGGITRDSTGAIKIGQEVNTTSDVTFNTVTATKFVGTLDGTVTRLDNFTTEALSEKGTVKRQYFTETACQRVQLV